MKLLSLFPFLLVAWAMLIFAYESYMDESIGGTIFNSVLAMVTIYWGIKIYRGKQHNKSNFPNLIAANIGLLPLLYSNLIFMPIILKGREINESGMVYVLVMIYSPMMYIGSLIPIMLYVGLRAKYMKGKI